MDYKPTEAEVMEMFRSSKAWALDPGSWDGPRPITSVTAWPNSGNFRQLDAVAQALGIEDQVIAIFGDGGFDYKMRERWLALAKMLDKKLNVGRWKDGSMRDVVTYAPDGMVTTGL